MRISLNTINIEAAAREASVPPSTLRYDLVKVIQTLPEVLVNQTPGPKPQRRTSGDNNGVSSQRTHGMPAVWREGQQERDVLGVELAADVGGGLVGCATSSPSTPTVHGLRA